MASRNFSKNVHHLARGPQGLVVLAGQVTVTGDTTPANSTSTVTGAGMGTAARTGTGQYTITLEDKYVGLHAAQMTLQADSALTTGQTLKMDSFVNSGTASQVLFEFTDEAGAAEDLTNDEVAVVHVTLFLDNSSL